METKNLVIFKSLKAAQEWRHTNLRSQSVLIQHLKTGQSCHGFRNHAKRTKYAIAYAKAEQYGLLELASREMFGEV